jgi:hypothetical protein
MNSYIRDKENSKEYDFQENKYRCAPVPTGNTFQDLPRLRETTDNTERYI